MTEEQFIAYLHYEYTRDSFQGTMAQIEEQIKKVSEYLVYAVIVYEDRTPSQFYQDETFYLIQEKDWRD